MPVKFRFSPYMDFGKHLGISDGATGTILPCTPLFGLAVVMDVAPRGNHPNDREVHLWGECIGPMAEGCD